MRKIGERTVCIQQPKPPAFQTGMVVRSLAGRDKGTLLVVCGVEEDGVLVCDGKKRPLERPKRKNPRHIAPTQQALPQQAMQYNCRLRKALTALQGSTVEQA